ncbi:hypothetical protein ABZ639_24505 [Saccharomonospora sp. NPDC006951]
MSGTRLGLFSLRADAIYCVLLGLILVALARLAANPVGLPYALLLAIGLTTMVWGGFVWWAGSRRPLRWTLRLVMAANIVASAALVLTGATAGILLLSIAAVVLSVDIGAFAAAQGIALRRMRPAAER